MAIPCDPVTSDAELGTETTDALRERLADDAGQIRAQLRDLDRDESTMAYDENFADSGQVAAEMGENLALAGQLREQLDDIEAALARIEDGTYGLCEVCGAPIGEARLEVMPATRFCIQHAG